MGTTVRGQGSGANRRRAHRGRPWMCHVCQRRWRGVGERGWPRGAGEGRCSRLLGGP